MKSSHQKRHQTRAGIDPRRSPLIPRRDLRKIARACDQWGQTNAVSMAVSYSHLETHYDQGDPLPRAQRPSLSVL